MKKFIIILATAMLWCNVGISNPSLDIGEDSKIVDINFMCTNDVNPSNILFFGFKSIEQENNMMVKLNYNKDKGKYTIPTSTVISAGELDSGYRAYVSYAHLFSDPLIIENILYAKGSDVKLISTFYKIDQGEMKKLEKIYDKMFKEPNNTKYIRMVKKLTHMTDTLIIRKEYPKVKKKSTFGYKCKDSEAVLKSG